MSSGTSLSPLTGAQAKAQELKQNGFERGSTKTIISRGREHRDITYEKHKVGGTFERICRGGLGLASVVTTPILGGMPLLGALGLDGGFYDATLKAAYHGSIKEHIYEETGVNEAIDKKLVGCNPNSNNSVQKFLEKNRPEWRESNGHNFMVGKGRKGISFFYFIPNGDVSKAYAVNFWTAKNGKSIMNTKKQLLAIRSYCAACEDIETKWEQEIPTLATRLMSLDPTNSRTLKEAEDAIRNQPRTIVIDARSGVARVYGPYDPNKVNPDSYRTGTAITLEKETIDSINEVHGPSMEHKEPLAGNRPFKTPPQNPLEDLMAQHRSQGGQPPMPGQGTPQGQRPPASIPVQRPFPSHVNIGSESEEDSIEVISSDNMETPD